MLQARFNIVLMGMGEPLHNYDAVMKALRMLADEHGLAVNPRRVTLSTVGVLPALERLATEPLMPNLAISLHATTEEQRDLLVPINRKYGLKELLDACRRFPVKRRERITFEYVMLKDVNDTDDDARRLVRLLNGIKAKVNLLPLNEAAGIPYERPSDARVNRFAQIVAERGLTVSVRKSRGRDIRAACGQLITESTRQKSPGQRLASLMPIVRSVSRRRASPILSMMSAHRRRVRCAGAGRDSHLQVVIRHHQRAVLERQARPDRARLRRRGNGATAPAPISRSCIAAIADRSTPWTLSRIADASVPGRSEYGKHVQVRQRRRRQVRRGSRRSRRRSRRETRRSCRSRSTRAAGASTMPSTSRGTSRACRAGASPRASGRWRAAAADGSAGRKRPLRRDEIDDRRRAVHRLERADAERDVAARPRRARAADRAATSGRQVAPVRSEMDAGHVDFLEARRRRRARPRAPGPRPAGCATRRGSSG